jgi:two-component system OmpR family response regulator
MSKTLEKILYVEDDEDIAEIAQMILEDIGGFEVMHCSSGQKALDAYPNYNPQLVLMDVMMPKMDGPETLENLRKMPEEKDTPVIFMTAKAQTHEQVAYRNMGALGVIVKPFDPETLCDHINALWERRHR